jgi:hypothetical protein
MYTLRQIKKAITMLYEDVASEDSWGCEYMYEGGLKTLIGSYLKNLSTETK